MVRARHLILFLFALTIPMTIYAQSGTVSSGGDIQSASGSVSFTIGQLSDSYNADEDGIVSEGLQQPYEVFIMTSSESPSLASLIKVFPNPTMDEIRVQLDETLSGSIQYTLMHQGGMTITTAELQAGQMHIPMSAYPAGTYMLSFSVEGQFKTTFKVVKTQ